MFPGKQKKKEELLGLLRTLMNIVKCNAGELVYSGTLSFKGECFHHPAIQYHYIIVDYLFVFTQALFVALRSDKLEFATNNWFKGVPEVIKSYFQSFKPTYGANTIIASQ